MFLSVAFTAEHGISESNKDLKLMIAEELMISDIIGHNGQQ